MLALLLESALRSLALALAVWLALRVLRVRNAHIRMTVWTVVLNTSLVMPLLMQLAGPWTTVVIPREVPSLQLPLPKWASSNAVQKPAGAAIELRDIQQYSRSPLTAEEGGEAPPAATEHAIDWLMVATGLYLVVAGALLIRLLIGVALAWHLWRAARPLNEDWTQEARVRMSDVLAVPVTIGRTILLPADCSTWSAAKQCAVLSHERSHVACRDFQVLLLARLNCAIFWFSPLSWSLLRQLAELAEIIGDEAAMAATGNAPAYAGILLDIARNARPASLAIAMARPHTVGRRVERILAGGPLAAKITLRRRIAIATGLVPLIAVCAVAIARGASPEEVVTRVEPAPAERQMPGAREEIPGAQGRSLPLILRGRVESGPSYSNQPAFSVAFNTAPPICPEGHGVLQISRGVVWFILSSGSKERAALRSISRPIADDAYGRVVGTDECRIDLAIRAQAIRDGRWTPLLVPKSMRPSLSAEERRQLSRPLTELLQKKLNDRKNGAKPSAEEVAQWLNGPGNLPRMIRIQQQTGAVATFLAFEEGPETCVEAVGEFWLDQAGMAFSFPTEFLDDANRFSIEHRRLDDFRAELVLGGRGCRVEIMIGKAIRAHDGWLSIQLDSIYPLPLAAR
jgi:beta-lactamase regulating signal transducer with metallopeptidase domain